MSITKVAGIDKLSASPVAIGGAVLGLILKLQAANKKRLKRRTSSTESFKAPLYEMDVIPVTSRQQEVYNYQANATQHAIESGALYSDHVILQPITLNLQFEISNWDGGEQSFESIKKAVERWEQREALTIITEHKVLDNMVCTSLQFDNSAPAWGALKGRASFQQVMLVKFNDESAAKPEPPVEPTAIPPQNAGNQNVQTSNVSAQNFVNPYEGTG